MDIQSNQQQQRSSVATRNPCSLSDALHHVDRNLVYDPVTKKLCLKNCNENPSNGTTKIHTNSCSTAKTFYHDDLKDNDEKCANYMIKDNVEDHQSEIDSMINMAKHLNLYDVNIYGEYQHDITNGTNVCVKRPQNLPPKSKDEERKHREQFLEILLHAQTKDLQRKKLRKDFVKRKAQQEDEIQKAIKIWTEEILPCWHQSLITKRVQNLWWNGIPSSIRPKVWNLVIGNDLHITEQLFHICLSRSREKIWVRQFISRKCSNPLSPMTSCDHKTHRRSASHSSEVSSCPSSSDQSIITDKAKDSDDDDGENIAFLIKLDVLRTFPQLGLFQETGPYHKSLCDVLSAYVVYRPDIGYCQGMSFLAAMLLLNSQSTFSAFTSLANLLNNELLMVFYGLNQNKMRIIYSYYDRQFHSLLPDLASHFVNIGLTTDLFFMYQVYTLFARSLSLDCVSRVWDIFLRDGNEFIFRASLGLLSMFKNELIKLEFIDSARFLSNLPEDMDMEKYFEIIASIKLVPPKLSTLLATDVINQTIIITNDSNTAKSRYSLFMNKIWRF